MWEAAVEEAEPVRRRSLPRGDEAAKGSVVGDADDDDDDDENRYGARVSEVARRPPRTSSDVYSRYGWRTARGDRKNASRNAEVATPERVRSWAEAASVRLRKALAAVRAEGSVRRVGTVTVERVKERPCGDVSDDDSLHPPSRVLSYRQKTERHRPDKLEDGHAAERHAGQLCLGWRGGR